MVRRKFSGFFYVFCMNYLIESIGKEFKNFRLVYFLWKVVYVISLVIFKEKMVEIEEILFEVAKWL